MSTKAAGGIVFWVVVREKASRKIISTTQFATHEEAVRYNPQGDPAAADKEVAIEILAPGKLPK